MRKLIEIDQVQAFSMALFKNKDLKPEELGVVEYAYKELERLPIFVQDSSGVTIEEIRVIARRFKKL